MVTMSSRTASSSMLVTVSDRQSLDLLVSTESFFISAQVTWLYYELLTGRTGLHSQWSYEFL